MSLEEQFWWNWAVYALAAVGTVGAVVVALFGEWIRAHLWPPKLVVSLRDSTDESVPTKLATEEARVITQSRWCHVHVENTRRRFSPATDVQVFLLSVEEPDAAGTFQLRWAAEPVPLAWSHQKYKPATFRIGVPRQADLCSVVQHPTDGTHFLLLAPLFQPFALPVRWETGCKLALTVQARGVEADSNKLRVEVAWNGEWSDDPRTMRRHLTVSATTVD